MQSTINMPAVLIANIMGVVILLTLIVGNGWRLKEKSVEYRALKALIIFTFVCCVVDPICFFADGREGTIFFLLVYGCNVWLFVAHLLMGPCFVIYISYHLNGKVSRKLLITMFVASAFGIALQVINLFSPIVFWVDNHNVYHRGPLYGIYILVFAVYLIGILVIYMYSRVKGGYLKQFPVWWFYIPIVLGVVIQSTFYGVSTIWPFNAISVGSIIIALQNESIFKDSLTGLYNRFYLDRIKEAIKRENTTYTAMMLDLNGFKGINDKFGHAEGDKALCDSAGILSAAVGSLGIVTRYAGDEFVVLLNTMDDDVIGETIQTIRQGFKEFNEKMQRQYQLSISVGYCKLDMTTTSMDAIFDMMDRKMYEDKSAYYAQNKGVDRRKRREESN